MEYVSEQRFVELLNEALVKDPKGAYLQPFVLGPQGYEWPHGGQYDQVYLHIANAIRERYGIYH